MEENIVEIEGIYVRPQSRTKVQTELSGADESLTDDESIAEPADVDAMASQRDGTDGNVRRSRRSRRAPKRFEDYECN